LLAWSLPEHPPWLLKKADPMNVERLHDQTVVNDAMVVVLVLGAAVVVVAVVGVIGVVVILHLLEASAALLPTTTFAKSSAIEHT